MPTISYSLPNYYSGMKVRTIQRMSAGHFRKVNMISAKPISNHKKRKCSIPRSFECQSLDNLFITLRKFLIFGKLLGVIPFTGIFQRDLTKVEFRSSSFPALFCLFVAAVLGLNAAVGVIALASGTSIKADQHPYWAPSMFIFYFTGVFTFIYFYNHSEDFLKILHNWNDMKLHYTEKDEQLNRDVNLLAGLVMLSGIGENALVHLKQFPILPQSESHAIRLKDTPNMTAWEVYYIRSHHQWAEVVPYHVVLAVYVFVSNKLALYTWNYLDIFIMILARAIYFRFKALYILGEAWLCDGNGDVSKWRLFVEEHEALCKLLDEINTLLSPLIFVSYANNVYFVCLQFNLSLNPSGSTTIVSSIYATWSFLHLIVRMYLVSLTGAKVHEWARKVVEIFRKCPNELYVLEVERYDRYVSTNVIGLSGCGCFVITKALMLQIISVVFTFEIVLLQTSQQL